MAGLEAALEVGKPWGHLPAAHWNKQAELPRGSQLPMANAAWEGSQECARLRRRSPRGVTNTQKTRYLLSRAIPVPLGCAFAAPLPFLLACAEIPLPEGRRRLFGTRQPRLKGEWCSACRAKTAGAKGKGNDSVPKCEQHHLLQKGIAGNSAAKEAPGVK